MGCRRTFLRLSFCANLLLCRFFSPGFRKKECRFTSLIMPSCWTCRLKRRSALSFTGTEQLISFVLKLLKRDLSTGVGLQMCVELIVLLHTGFAGRACRDTGTEFLKVYTYPVEGETASAVGTFNSRQCWA